MHMHAKNTSKVDRSLQYVSCITHVCCYLSSLSVCICECEGRGITYTLLLASGGTESEEGANYCLHNTWIFSLTKFFLG